MSVVTAKVQVASAVTDANNELTRLTFVADYTDGRNEEWAKYTPSLQLNVAMKPEVGERFKVGQKYTLTFEESAE